MEFIKQLNETLNSINFSQLQFYCLLLIFISPTEEIAMSIVEKNEKFMEAVKLFKENNLINFVPNGYSINKKGISVLEFNGFLENGILTDKGKNLLRSNSNYIK